MPSKLKRFIDAKGVTSYRLQKDTGLAYNTIYRLLRKDNVGTIDTWRRIASALGTTVDEIINYEGEGHGRERESGGEVHRPPKQDD